MSGIPPATSINPPVNVAMSSKSLSPRSHDKPSLISAWMFRRGRASFR